MTTKTFEVGEHVIVKPRDEIFKIVEETHTPINFVTDMYKYCMHEYVIKEIFVGSEGVERATMVGTSVWYWDTRWLDPVVKVKVEFTETDLSDLLNE